MIRHGAHSVAADYEEKGSREMQCPRSREAGVVNAVAMQTGGLQLQAGARVSKPLGGGYREPTSVWKPGLGV